MKKIINWKPRNWMNLILGNDWQPPTTGFRPDKIHRLTEQERDDQGQDDLLTEAQEILDDPFTSQGEIDDIISNYANR